MDVVVRELNDSTFHKWDEFVEKSKETTFFHRSEWKTVLERSFGHRTYFLYAEHSNGMVLGILPLAQINSLLFGKTLSSLPFCVYGGIVAETDEAEEVLRKAACHLATTNKVDALEMRNINASKSNWLSKDLYVTFRKEISSDNEENLLSIPNRQRAVVRKGIKAGLKCEFTSDWKRLYRVYSESVRNLGTPVFSEKYFLTLKDVFHKDCSILMVTHENRDVAGVMSFYFKDQVLPYYAGSNNLARNLYAHGYMYWELMKNSSERGVRVFDYGRSKVGTGSYSFKKNWGFTPEKLHYEYYLVNSKSIPNLNPMNPKYQLFIRLWKLLPLSAANILGPILSRSLG